MRGRGRLDFGERDARFDNHDLADRIDLLDAAQPLGGEHDFSGLRHGTAHQSRQTALHRDRLAVRAENSQRVGDLRGRQLHHAVRRSQTPCRHDPGGLGRGRRSRLLARTGRLAAALETLGVRPGDRIAVLLPNGPRFVEAWWAAVRRGVIVMPPEIGFMLNDDGVGCIIGHSERHP